ncbi:hypothetical protein ES703_109824 [subsurface metagenome]
MRCPLCFQVKPLIPAPVKGLPDMCKGCFYKLDQMIGYLNFYGCNIQLPLFPPKKPPDEVLEGLEKKPKEKDKKQP